MFGWKIGRWIPTIILQTTSERLIELIFPVYNIFDLTKCLLLNQRNITSTKGNDILFNLNEGNLNLIHKFIVLIDGISNWPRWHAKWRTDCSTKWRRVRQTKGTVVHWEAVTSEMNRRFVLISRLCHFRRVQVCVSLYVCVCVSIKKFTRYSRHALDSGTRAVAGKRRGFGTAWALKKKKSSR